MNPMATIGHQKFVALSVATFARKSAPELE